MTMFDDVKDFHTVMEIYVGEQPHIPPYKEEVLRRRLISEEYTEWKNASHEKDIVQIAKELCDLVYVALGAAVVYGIPFNEVWDAVHMSNMNKMEDGKVRYREDGKVAKPEGWEPPDLTEVIARYVGPSEPSATL
jgi:predicted HAD superfamily Cof-like phosphohydrolase